jgi:hypothetical protein
MEILVLARAPSREIGLAFMEAAGVVQQIVLPNGETARVPAVQAVISTSDDGWMPGRWVETGTSTGSVPIVGPGGHTPEPTHTFEPRDGWFVNVKYYGETAAALCEGGDPTSPDLFERAPGLLLLSEMRTGKPMTWTALSSDPHPPGYENADGVRLYDPQFIATPANVIA